MHDLKKIKKEIKKMDGLNPITRKETFLAAAAGQDVTTPTPVTREEVFLDAIAKSGGGGSSGGGVLVVTDTDGTLNKTWQEIHDADYSVLKEATVIPVGEVIEYTAISAITHLSEDFTIIYGNDQYVADSANSFPVLTGEQ